VTALAIVKIAAVVVTAIGAITDWRTGTIPNWLTLGAGALAVLVHGWLGGMEGLLMSGGGALVCVAMPYLIFRLGGIGGGDVKMFAAIGAMLGPFDGVEAEFYAVVAGAIFALGRFAWEGKLLRILGNTVFVAFNPILPKKWRRTIAPEQMSSFRLGTAIFVGTALAVALTTPQLARLL
jgi:prepilin peptidase CpaA